MYLCVCVCMYICIYMYVHIYINELTMHSRYVYYISPTPDKEKSAVLTKAQINMGQYTSMRNNVNQSKSALLTKA